MCRVGFCLYSFLCLLFVCFLFTNLFTTSQVDINNHIIFVFLLHKFKDINREL
jgi:hypothetical protein